MRHVLCLWAVCAAVVPAWLSAETKNWPQWRGPERNGMVTGPAWPASLAGLERRWRVELGPSYSGPIVTDDRIFVTETKDKKTEVVTALDRATGKAIWKAEWDGAISVPFFAASNGSWIRSTPAFDGERLYVAGIRDVLVCLQASDGKELWRMDFVSEMKAPVPSFGFVCSPLLDGDAVYVQAGASLVKLDKMTGKVLWRALKDDGGMEGSAFSSPILTDLNARRQLIVQTRQKLAGLDPASGNVLWSQEVPAFRGMNILTPTIWNGQIFTSTYGGKSFSVEPKESGGQFEVSTNWENKSKGYMSTPVVIDGHAYLHLQNQRFTCIELATGKECWTTPKTFGKYWSLVANGDRILALDQKGELLLIRANPEKFDLIESKKVSDQETWAHIAVCGTEVAIRELNAMSVFDWK
ncbi:MAG: outer membrane protein assembly factor BamB precursor [Planctomycetota bacterium]